MIFWIVTVLLNVTVLVINEKKIKELKVFNKRFQGFREHLLV